MAKSSFDVANQVKGHDMKELKVLLIAMTLIVPTYSLAQHHRGDQASSSVKNPAIAAALSLQPLPMDLGGFYAGNWERGIIYTAAEIALFIPAVVLVAENSNWGHHSSYYYVDANRRTWTDDERNRFYYFVGGYFIVKLISAFDAGYSVERRKAQPSFGYDERSQSLSLSLAIPIR